MPRLYKPTLQRFRSLWREQKTASKALNTCSPRGVDRAQEAYLTAFWAAVDVGEAVLASTRDAVVAAEICRLVRNDPCGDCCELGDLAVDKLLELTLSGGRLCELERPALGGRTFEATHAR